MDSCLFSRAILGNTTIDGIDITKAFELDEVHHYSNSSVSTDTLELTYRSMRFHPDILCQIELFMHNASPGAYHISKLRSSIISPRKYASVFLSYSHYDRKFARRLAKTFRRHKVDCWIDEHSLHPGDKFHEKIHMAIKQSDKFLLCCSEPSLTSWWVEDEILAVLEKERNCRAQRKNELASIIPLNLDNYLLSDWNSGFAPQIKCRQMVDFRGWEFDATVYKRGVNKLLSALMNREYTIHL